MTSAAIAIAEPDALAVSEAALREALKPPPRLTVSEWADEYRVLSRESSAEPGPWRTDRAPYLRGIMDAFSDPSIEKVVFMKASQLGATEVLSNVVGYFIHQDPSPMLIIQPNVTPMAEAYSKDRLAPMLRDSPALRELVSDPRSRDSGNTTFHKKTAGGGVLTCAGANSAAGLASRPIRVALFDEVDRFPASAGTEGDPIALGEARTTTFWNRKLGYFSSPGLKGSSRIEAAYEESDQRRYFVPCPECEEYQVLRWSGIMFARTDDGELVSDSVRYKCADCGELIEESAKPEMLARGEWRADKPIRSTAGFFLNALYSPWATWAEIAEQFLRAQGNNERLKAWVNTKLAETWEEKGARLDVSDARIERFSAEVPDGVGILTMGVDVHADRLEALVVGWGVGQESWRILHERLYGDTEQAEVWQRLEAIRVRPYRHVNGSTLRIRATAVDSGSITQPVYAYVVERQGSGVLALKGRAELGRPIVSRPGKRNAYGVRIWPVGTHAAKDTLFARMVITRPGPGYMHFCAQAGEGMDAEYFAQFAGEEKRLHYVRGVLVPYYKQIRERNEAIDLDVYALVALHALGRTVHENLEAWVEEVKNAAPTARPTDADDEDEEPEEEAEYERSGFVNRWRRR